MQDKRRAQTQASRSEESTNGAINLRVSSHTEVRGDSPSL